MNLNEIDIPQDADEAAIWAAEREFDLRYARLKRSRLGVSGAFAEAARAMNRMAEVLKGDPGPPPPPPAPRVNKPPATEFRGI